ncbi:MAG: 5'-nucleotidase C-terminal domain-containing protein [Firmicutes bacterium]|nr:5'-nucleotidase C-terminal domain-containing protein [Bacillota bacterium]
MKKLLSLLTALAIVLSLAPAAFADEEGSGSAAPAAEAGSEDIVILHTNDVHCGYLPYDRLVTLAKEADLLIDNGDAIQGDVIGTVSKGEYITDIMNYAGYDLAVPGNHEFDYGMEQFLHIAKDLSEFPYVCCNFIDLRSGQQIFEPYKIFEIKGKKLAFIGIATPETLAKSDPVTFQDGDGNFIYSFCEGGNGQELYDAVQKAADAARAEGADWVIAVGHLGVNEESSPWSAFDVIANTTGIDAFIDGHSHSTYAASYAAADGRLVPAAQTGTKLANIGRVILHADGSVTAEIIPADEVEPEPEATAFLEGITAQFKALSDTVVAHTDVPLTIMGEDGKRAVRNTETNLGDLCSDAYRILLGADIALVGGGGIRTDIAAGDITYGNAIAVHPFGNYACLAEVSGQQIADALELGCSALPGELGGFNQVSGLTFTVNTAIPSPVVLNDQSEFVRVEGQRRVSDVMIGGEPLDLEKTYTLASHDFMLKSCGDGYSMFGEKNIKLLKDCIMLDNQVLIRYITEELGGSVGQEYAEPQGRITIIYDESKVEKEEPADAAPTETSAPVDPAAPSDPAPAEPSETAPAEPSAPAEPAAPDASTALPAEYTVVKGDSLWKISDRFYGEGRRWRRIYDANRSVIKDPDLIYPDQIFSIPAAE